MKAKTLGYSGETLAAQFLKNKGYEILQNNFTIRGGEIDLIALHGTILIFVEVKTRTNESFGRGEESMNYFKRTRIHRAIERYLDRHGDREDTDYRVDLIEVELDPTTKALKNINHFEDIEL
ncbi:YraN family protein [Candidatus Peregrinibacteria bacterium]|nr:YraN family protein [Candidatus Peregrinibacteria bacterium]